jgi:Flp pilus assembly protein TadG
LILIAVAFVVLLGFVGLTTDVGQLFIYMGHLRRALDAASLAAAGQFREGRTMAEMTASASEVVGLNGIDPNIFTVTVKTCESLPNPPDPGDQNQLCTTPRRKLVKVEGTLAVPTIFLQLVGVNTITISATSIGEAASLDVVLAIDISESMAWDRGSGDPLRDPSVCNAVPSTGGIDNPGDCRPFEDVKRAAINFVNRILDKPAGQEQDRLGIVTFANGYDSNPDRGTAYRTVGWTSDNSTAVSIIQNLKIYEPGECFMPRPTDPNNPPVQSYGAFYGPCRYYDNDPGDPPTNPNPNYGNFLQFDCLSCRAENWAFLTPPEYPVWSLVANQDWSYLPTTNIGGALLRSGNIFALDSRPDALWVVVILTDGIPNATDPAPGDSITNWTSYPFGYCPREDQFDASGQPQFPLCQDKDVSTRHVNGAYMYDADDYARDMTDFVGCSSLNPAAACHGEKGQGAVIFSIGLGNAVLDSSNEAHGLPYGATLLRYIARVGYAGDPDPANDPCKDQDAAGDYTAWCGNYYFSPQGPQLTRIFEAIASKIFTRLVH